MYDKSFTFKEENINLHCPILLICSFFYFFFLDSQLTALVEFDREEKKIYHVPIAIEDSGSPAMTGTSTLMVVIGDENDNAMKEGSSEIFFYKYMV